MLKDCPMKPNCVSSKELRQDYHIEPLHYEGSFRKAQQRMLDVLSSLKRMRVVSVEDNQIRAESVSAIMRYVDDIEFTFNERLKLIHVKSASRKGYYDLGVNRRRVEKIRKLFKERENNEHLA